MHQVARSRFASSLLPRVAALTVVAAATVGVSIAASPGPPVTGADGDYTSIDPARLLDTRTTDTATTVDGLMLGGGEVTADSVTTVAVASRGNVSASATAAMLNVTAVNPGADGFLTVSTCADTTPTTSNLNFDTGTTIANAVLAPIGDDGNICIYASAATQIVVDVSGYTQNGSPVSIDSARLADTRLTAGPSATIDGTGFGTGPLDAQTFRSIEVTGRGDVPATAVSAVLNVTAVNPSDAGFLTVFPCGADVPTASNVNFAGGDTVAQTTVVAIGASGSVCVYTSAHTDLVVDVDGYVESDEEPPTITPARLLDTRETGTTIDGESQGAGVVAAGSTTSFEATDRAGIPDDANVVLLSVTAVNPADHGFLTVFACGGDVPVASNVNYAAGQTVPNFAAIAVGETDQVCVYSSASTHLIVDTTGYYETAVVETTPPTTTVPGSLDSCEQRAELFTTRGSVNPQLADPTSSAVCQGSDIIVSSNGIPDYTYIRTSPGDPGAQDYSFTIPAEPAMAAQTSDVARLGSIAVALNGVPIYGPTEGTGGDVLSLAGTLSDCGSHNGPTGFHLHLLGTSDTTDCIFTPEEVASGPQLLGFAFDGYPIYSGNDQYESSWQLTNASLFSTDTWSAHSYVAGSGDLDECNGRVDENGDYAYYTTDTFPYILGCYSGTPAENGAGGGGPGGPPR